MTNLLVGPLYQDGFERSIPFRNAGAPGATTLVGNIGVGSALRDATNGDTFVNNGTQAAPQYAQVDAEQFCILLADYVLTNGTAAQAALNASTNGAVALGVGTYAFEAQYYLTNTGTTSHFWETLFAGTATISNILYSIAGNSLTSAGAGTGAFNGVAKVATAIQATPASTSATENALVQLVGVLTTTAAGTLIPQIQLSAAPGGAQAMKAGSFFRIWHMSPSGLIGNWT